MHLNPKSKGRWKWLLVIVVPVVALGVIGKMTNTNPPTNAAKTTPDETPALRTRVYSQDVEAITNAARTIATGQKTWFRSWHIPPQSEATSGTPHRDFRIEVPVLFFTDDLTVHIDTDDKGQTVVNVTSKSRVGQGDFGENRRHVAQFLRALDKEIGNSGI